MAHHHHRRGSSLGWGWLSLSLDPPPHITGHSIRPHKGTEPSKRAPSKPPVVLSHSITSLGHRYCRSPGGCPLGPGPSQQASPCPGKHMIQSPRVRGSAGQRHRKLREGRNAAPAPAPAPAGASLAGGEAPCHLSQRVSQGSREEDEARPQGGQVTSESQHQPPGSPHASTRALCSCRAVHTD